MSHIIILGEWSDLVPAIDDNSDAIQQRIDTAEKGVDMSEAENLQTQAADLFAAINTSFRTQADALKADQETFLGI